MAVTHAQGGARALGLLGGSFARGPRARSRTWSSVWLSVTSGRPSAPEIVQQ